MKREKITSKVFGRFSKREYLPLLRGMFVSPRTIKLPGKNISQDMQHLFADFPESFETVGTVSKFKTMGTCQSHASDDGLILTADEGHYLGS